MKQKPYISTQKSVLTRDIRAKICTKVEAKTTFHYYTNKCYNEGYTVQAKICTKIEAKTENEAGCRD